MISSWCQDKENVPKNFLWESCGPFELKFFGGDNEEYCKAYFDAMHQDNYKIHDEMSDLFAFIEKYEAETMYYHQGTKTSRKNLIQRGNGQ